MNQLTDSSKIAGKLKFKFHSDPGHGWLAVKISLIRELGLDYQISAYSYVRGKTAYLEEDRDVGIFIRAFRERFGIEPSTLDLGQKNSSSPIRSMEPFSPEII